MPYVNVRHRVNNYKEWRRVFDEDFDFRKKGGEKSFRLYHIENDPNNIRVVLEWESLDKARTFFNSQELKLAMQESGVTEEPEISFEEAY